MLNFLYINRMKANKALSGNKSRQEGWELGDSTSEMRSFSQIPSSTFPLCPSLAREDMLDNLPQYDRLM